MNLFKPLCVHQSCFVFFSRKLMFSLFLRLPEKDSRPKWTIYKPSQTKIRSVCLSSSYSVARLQPTPAQILSKIPDFILDYANVARLFNFFCPMSEKKVMESPLILLCCISTFLQTFTDCVSNQCIYFSISTCQMWLQVMEFL